MIQNINAYHYIFFQKKNGSANKEIIEIANKIKNILIQHNINIKLIVTDGDTKYNSKSQQKQSDRIIFPLNYFPKMMGKYQTLEDS